MSYKHNGATHFNPKFTLGETWLMDVLIQDVDGTVVDLTGTAGARWRMANDTAVLIDVNLGSGIEWNSDPKTGILHIRIEPNLQNGVLPTEPHKYYRHELRLTDNPVVGTSTQMIGRVAVLDSLFRKFP